MNLHLYPKDMFKVHLWQMLLTMTILKIYLSLEKYHNLLCNVMISIDPSELYKPSPSYRMWA